MLLYKVPYTLINASTHQHGWPQRESSPKTGQCLCLPLSTEINTIHWNCWNFGNFKNKNIKLDFYCYYLNRSCAFSGSHDEHICNSFSEKIILWALRNYMMSDHNCNSNVLYLAYCLFTANYTQRSLLKLIGCYVFNEEQRAVNLVLWFD